MKETKVYVDELPKSCDECPCHSVMEDRCVLLRKQAIEPFLQSCPLKSLKTHDRELVKEVCEKIKAKLLPYFSGSNDYEEKYHHIVIEILQNLQKEYEKWKIKI